MPDFDYPYEDAEDPKDRRPQSLSEWQEQQRAKGRPSTPKEAAEHRRYADPIIAGIEHHRNATALDVAVIEQHQRWRTEGVDPDAPDAEDSIRIANNNARFAAEVEAFAESWLLDSEIADIVLANIDPADWQPGPGL